MAAGSEFYPVKNLLVRQRHAHTLTIALLADYCQNGSNTLFNTLRQRMSARYVTDTNIVY